MPFSIPYPLILGVLLGSIFAYLISFGRGKRLTEEAGGRVMLGAIGFLIALGTYGLWTQSLQVFLVLGLWFLACCLPVAIGSVVSGHIERNRLVEAHQAEIGALRAEHAEALARLQAESARVELERQLDTYSVVGND